MLQLKVRNEKKLITVIGNIFSPQPGELIEAVGQWVMNKDYGRQFKASDMKSVPPTSLEGITKYLGSGLIRGVGPGFAKLLVDSFGENVFNIIENSSYRLNEVPRLGKARIQTIIQSWKDQKFIRTIMVFLQSHGVSSSRAVRIYRTYGDRAIDVVRENPYCLARDIQGIGFKIADQIALSLGIPLDSLFRARAGLSYVLNQAINQGHCALPEQVLLQQAESLLEIPASRISEGLALEYSEGNLIRDQRNEEPWAYLEVMFNLETEVAHRFEQSPLMLRKKRTPQEIQKEIDTAQVSLKIELADLQKKSVQLALEKRFSIVTGGPGTGKSTLTKVLTKILQDRGLRIILCSPTGRAAKRLAECTGLEAKTLHRTLGVDPITGGFSFNEKNKLSADVVIVDEVSMLDIFLVAALLRALPSTASLLLIGDRDQLPSVGPGRILADLLDSGKIPFVRLSQIFRQATESNIITSAHAINLGEMPKLDNKPDSDIFFFEIQENQSDVDLVIDIVTQRIPKKFGLHPRKDIQVLCPMLKGDLGVRNLNECLQKILNPNPPTSVQKFGVTFGVGDKVIITKNDYEKDVFNGDIGFIQDMDHELLECSILIDERVVVFSFDDLDIVQQAYALTVHKSQGSEYPAVVIPVSTQHFVMLKRNLLYTAVTRGKELVVLVGQKRALSMAIAQVDGSKRYTRLMNRIQEKCLES